MVTMKKDEFYKNYIPALIRALDHEQNCEQFNLKGPQHFLNVSDELKREMDIYLDTESGKDEFLDSVAYYFDAKSHGFSEINGVKIDQFKLKIENEIMNYKILFNIV